MMAHAARKQLVYTEKDRCRVCYTCVRECPVKAIRIINGQAEVINERCIGCGNCVRVCSQGAKDFIRTTGVVWSILASHRPRVALVAPSFPAEFQEIDAPTLVGMIRRLGFDQVVEVGFGADLVAREYERMMNEGRHGPSISSDCPAIVFYVEHYYPHLVPALAPIASPVVAMARVMRQRLGPDCATVFIGPCISKKVESDELDEVITFTELRQMFLDGGIRSEGTTASAFDPPHAGKGAIFPVSRGLLNTLKRDEDEKENGIIVAEGRVQFREAIREFDSGLLGDMHLQLLCCEGCIMGPGTSAGGKRFARRMKVKEYVQSKLDHESSLHWEQEMEAASGVDLSQEFFPRDRRLAQPGDDPIQEVLASMGKQGPSDHLNCGACGYDTCREHAVAIAQGLAENEMCLPYAIEKLHRSIGELHISNEKLASAREALRQSEKLAHMGQLSAGIAHELNNPLGVITMYANILLDETAAENPVRQDIQLIADQTDRCRKIVGGLLNFARKNQVNREETNVVVFARQSLDSVVIPSNIQSLIENQMKDEMVWIDRDQMMQVMTNLLKNAIEAMPEGGMLRISLSEEGDQVGICVEDSGSGIPDEYMDKIFTPFFTTKGPGKGTGLGLPIIYGIVKMHSGKINVESNDDPAAGSTGTRFSIILPRTNGTNL
ncbi:MAG TPA: [Fe-Fe] hydrogenase large subunit C-terminal domain-containing protein [Bacteroidales bacterium]|nr:[Fe-Fe] hydrogenase large subunit C-terminal domain-containing protein [Bacteroidales bacterium]